jgi:hypothetical protein
VQKFAPLHTVSTACPGTRIPTRGVPSGWLVGAQTFTPAPVWPTHVLPLLITSYSLLACSARFTPYSLLFTWRTAPLLFTWLFAPLLLTCVLCSPYLALCAFAPPVRVVRFCIYFKVSGLFVRCKRVFFVILQLRKLTTR